MLKNINNVTAPTFRLCYLKMHDSNIKTLKYLWLYKKNRTRKVWDQVCIRIKKLHTSILLSLKENNEEQTKSRE